MIDKIKRPGQKLGLFMAVALVMGNMIGSGVFLLPASLAPFGWNAVVGWVVTIGGAVCLAHVLATLTKSHARAIGPAELVEHSFGPLAGFLIGFAFWVSVWAGCATISVGAVSYLSSFIPVLGEHPSLSALGVIWLVTGVNLIGVRAAGSFQVLTMILKLVPLVVVIALIAVVFGTEGTAVLPPLPEEGLSLGSVNTAAAIALWALVGFEAAFAASDKIENPQRNVARATIWGAILTGIIYLVVCSGIALMLPVDQVADTAAPFTVFVATYWSPGPAAFIGLFAAISAIGAVNGWTLVQGELPLEMARRRMMPQWFAATLENGVPFRGLLLSSVLASILIMSNSSRTMGGLFTFMALLTTSVTLWLYLACAAAALKQRLAIPTAIAGAIFGVWSLVGAGWDAAGLSVVLMLMGFPLYWWTRRKPLSVQEVV
ncbi:amino acid permease [Parasphingorhabdus sp.]|jgi:APA family basic amino acid/polyamine antiporter|uniref:APC family permease n=1 Tax=Parasphingorhabdus sp. TaxID=2709688 RepID=UPI0030AD416A|nr:amino acid permease [Sphingomonadales bacterium]